MGARRCEERPPIVSRAVARDPLPPHAGEERRHFPVFPCCEGISKSERRNLRARVSSGVRSSSHARLPLTPRHATESGAPDISCYVFGNAAVCLGIWGVNRRIFFCTFAARTTLAVGRKCVLQPVGDAARKRSAFRLVCRPNPGTSAGRKSPVLESQVIDFPEDFALQNFRANEPRTVTFHWRSEGISRMPNTGYGAGPDSPVPNAQAIESAADFGMKKFRINPSSGRGSRDRAARTNVGIGRRERSVAANVN